jgi:fumarylacetoacetate (FAA) hydrolase
MLESSKREAAQRMRHSLPEVASVRDFYAFEQHVATCRKHRGLAMVPEWYEVPVFYFSNPAGVIGHEAEVFAPRGSRALDYELELACVIGREARDLPADDRALECVAGFTIMNDWSARDLQRVEMAVGLGPSKGKDFATSLGPELVSFDELADRYEDGRLRLEMTAAVNGRVLSRGNSASMHWTWPQLLAHASRDATLRPGDVLGSGTVGTGCILELTPEAVGGWLKPGDIVELTIERLGTLRNRVVDHP